MNILIIGNGFIAYEIIQRLEAEGHQLIIYSRRQRVDIQSTQIVGDIFDFEKFIGILSYKPQIIIHTAWITTHNLYSQDPSNDIYCQFTTDLADSLLDSGVKHLIVLGSCAEYGSQIVESTAGVTNLNPENFYAKQKVKAFTAVKETLSESDVRFTWARIFQPYGPGQDQKRLLPYLIDTLKSGNQVKLMNTSSILDWVTTRDIASAVSWIIKGDTPMEVDIGTTVGVSNIDLLRQLEALLGSTSQWKTLIQHESSAKEIAVVGKNTPLFAAGWTPSDTLKSGLEWVLDS